MNSLLGSRYPEVALHVAVWVLRRDPGDEDALSTIERIASDPSIPIPLDTRFGRSVRHTALDHVLRRFPENRRWTEEHIQRRLEDPIENPGVVSSLLEAMERHRPMSCDEKAEILAAALEREPHACAAADLCSALYRLTRECCCQDPPLSCGSATTECRRAREAAREERRRD